MKFSPGEYRALKGLLRRVVDNNGSIKILNAQEIAALKKAVTSAGGNVKRNKDWKDIPYKYFKSSVHYDPETGDFTSKIRMRGKYEIGDTIDTPTKMGYKTISVCGVTLFSHKAAFLYVEGYVPEGVVDHINQDRSDNRWSNLREVSVACNVRNTAQIAKSSSGIRGVSFMPSCKNKWCASIGDGRKGVVLGRFQTKEEAAIARWEAEKKYGYPGCCSHSSAYTFLKSSGII